MYNDNKHPTDWSRGRRNDFPRYNKFTAQQDTFFSDLANFRERDDRYVRRDNYYNTPYSPKRRKLDSGEAETVEYDNTRRTQYSPYDVPSSLSYFFSFFYCSFSDFIISC